LKKIWQWIKHRIAHKLEHVKVSKLSETLKKHGLALVIIIVGWEIIEDVLFPILFIWMGNHIHPAFYAGAPAAWILCLHWLAVPLIWGAWIRIKGKSPE
jgi:hypothetical protein